MSTEPNPLISARHTRYLEIADALAAVVRDLDAAGITPLHTQAAEYALRQRVADRQVALERAGF